MIDETPSQDTSGREAAAGTATDRPGTDRPGTDRLGTDRAGTDRKAPASAPRAQADRIAKVMARAGVASRREAERMILEGRVTVNGTKIASPALDVLPTDRITVDGKKLEEPQETRMWLYYKPLGLVTSENDELGRQTVFDALPRDMPRVMTVGRLDLNSEGLLLLTNDGELKRRLELPATGWLRRYRVRVNGTPSDMTFDPLRRGVTIEGEDFAAMEIKLDSQQGANAWLTVGIREGKNREIRRAMAHVGLQVNRLIRVGYGPFKLTGMDKNQVTEVKRKVLRDQLGGLLTGEVEEKTREMRPRGAAGARGPRPTGDRPQGERFQGGRPQGDRPHGDRQAPGRFQGESGPRNATDRPDRPREGDRPMRSWGSKSVADKGVRAQGSGPGTSPDPTGRSRPGGDKPRWKKSGAGADRAPLGRGDGPRKPFGGPRPDGDRKPFGGSRHDAERKPYAGQRSDGDRKPYDKPRPDGDRKPYGGPRPDGDRKPSGKPRPDGDRKPYGGPRADGERKPFGGPRPDGDRKPFGKPRADADRKPFGGPRPDGDRKPFGKPRPEGGAKPGPRGAGGGFPGKPKPRADRPGGDRPSGGRPAGSGRPGGKPRG